MIKSVFILLASALAACGQLFVPTSSIDTNYFLYSGLSEGQGSVIADIKGGHIGFFANAEWSSPGVIIMKSNVTGLTVPGITYVGTNWADNPTNLTAGIWFKYTGSADPAWWAFLLGKCGNSTNPIETGDGWFLTVVGTDSGAKYENLAGAVIQNGAGLDWKMNLSNTNVTDGNWHWIVGVWTGGTDGATRTQVYVDGVAGITNDVQGIYRPGCANTNNVQIGNCGNLDATCDDNLAQPVIVTWALTSSQVSSIYNTAVVPESGNPSVNWGVVVP
jgi:hypothetical protein